MIGISYHLDTEVHLNTVYLKMTLEDPQKRGLSSDKLLGCAQKATEKEALEILIREERSFRQRSHQNFSHFETCRVSPKNTFALLKMLGATGRLMWKGRKIFIDPFTEIELIIEASKSKETLLLSGKWKSRQHQGEIYECEQVFVGNPGWVIKNHIIHPLSGPCDYKWLKRIYPKPTLLEGLDTADFLKALNNQDFPEIQWVDQDPFSSKNGDEPFPFLILHDRHGAFADLWFDYGSFGKVAAHDEMNSLNKAFWRNKESEKNAQSDLLETDFIKKTVDFSHYYCPLDKVSKSLTFILEIGWKIFDHRGKKVLKQKREEIKTEVSDAHILIRGKIHYDQHQVDLKDFVGSFNRRERFIDLSSTEVGLLETHGGEKWEGLSEYELICDTVAVKKQNIGLLAPLLSKEESQDYSELFRCLPEGWQAAQGNVCSSFQGQLFPYQKEGLKWLEFLRESNCGGLLADEMGLGKTVQVLAFISQLSLEKPCLIVVPTSLLFNWRREFERFLPSLCVHIHAGKTRLKNRDELLDRKIIVTSYAILRLDEQLLKEIDYQVIVLDEAQVIKNPESQIARIAFSLRGDMRLCCSGTPIENRLQDLWSLFHFLLPGLLGERNAFHAQMSAVGSDVRYLQMVKRKIRPFLLRRKKEGVSLQLPPKMEQVVWVDMTEEQRTIYDHWLASTKAGLVKKIALAGASAHRMEILEAILRLRQLCVHPWLVQAASEEQTSDENALFGLSGKCERLFLDLTEVVQEGKKVIIYSQFTTMLHLIRREVANKGWSYVYLDGGTKNREAMVQKFQEDVNTSIFLISLKAGGVGLNLTSADYVFLFDPWWNEAVEQQAIDRAHRVGRTDTVIARRYVTALSIEEKIMHLKKHKLSLVKGLFEGGSDMSSLSLEDLMQLIDIF